MIENSQGDKYKYISTVYHEGKINGKDRSYLFRVKCVGFYFPLRRTKPDIQFVKVVFAMRLEFGLNI